MKHEVYLVIKQFFEYVIIHTPVNCTSITLITKVPHATSISKFRPISYCSVFYRIISRIITQGIQLVIGYVVDSAQSGFILDRQILYNILLASELIKGYERKGLSPKCVIKIDLQKAYDSVERPFLEAMLLELGFPSKMGTIDHGMCNHSILFYFP